MIAFNSETILNGWADNITATAEKLDIKKVLNAKKDEILAVFKREGKTASPEKIELTFSAVPADEKLLVYRLVLDLKQVGNVTPEFKNASIRNHMVIPVEISVAPGEAAADVAAAFAKALKTVQTLKSTKIFDIENAAGVLTLTVKDSYVHFDEDKTKVVAVSTSLTGYEAHEDRDVTKKITVGHPGVFDTRWMFKNVRLPSVANLHWGAVHAGEMPVAGVVYTQYTIHVRTDRPELTGLAGVGQEVKSKTTHILYCDAASAAKLETELATVGATVETVA